MSFDARPGDGTRDPRPTGSLLSDALNQVTRLVRGEVALAKAEAAQAVRSAAMGIAMLVGTVVLALVALNVLAAALVAALAEAGMGPGWAALLVGALILAAAGLLAWLGIRSLKSIAPTRTIANVQADAQTIKESVQ